MKNIYLIGYMGTGKSTIGKQLTDYLRVNVSEMGDLVFAEMDDLIELEQKRSIKEIFKTDGEEAFREMETKLLIKISKRTDLIVSCGGGVILNKDNVARMKETGRVIWLDASPNVVYERLFSTTNRPLLSGDKMNPGYIGEMMKKREPLYKEASQMRINTDHITIEEIVRLLFPALK